MYRHPFAFLIMAALLLTLSLAKPSHAETTGADLSGIKTYLADKTAALKTGAEALKKATDEYYALAQAAKFDYAALWAAKPADVTRVLKEAKAAWIVISPLYEQMEGIVAGVPVLQMYDPILDSGVKDEVDYDLPLPDGTTLKKPGNLFGLLETSLWGTDKAEVKLQADLDGNGTLDFGDVIPDAVRVKGFGDGMAKYSADLAADAAKWSPTEKDAFTALVTMVPTMKEYFNSWKTSRFILGDKAEHGDFSVISRLADVQDIVSSLQVVYKGVSPLVAAKDATLDKRIGDGLADLRDYAANLYSQEQKGKKFTPEQADLFTTEAQSNADAITGQIAQVAAQLGIQLEVK